MYHHLHQKLEPYVFHKNKELAEDSKNHTTLKGWAIEDARYIVCLAAEGQLGMTVNARNLELMIRRFASNPLAELGELNLNIYELVKDVAPSIILFTESNDFDATTYRDLNNSAAEIP